VRIPVWPGVKLTLWGSVNPQTMQVGLAAPLKKPVKRIASMPGWAILFVRYNWKKRYGVRLTFQPVHGDAVDKWLQDQRDRHDRHGESSKFWHEINDMVNRYRLHADAGRPLGSHVCDATTVEDCDCTEAGR
jgi:hypothetical protein